VVSISALTSLVIYIITIVLFDYFYESNTVLFQIIISFDRFYDPDIEDMTEKYAAVDKYEFAITDNSNVRVIKTVK
jgi:hypothetical protein